MARSRTRPRVVSPIVTCSTQACHRVRLDHESLGVALVLLGLRLGLGDAGLGVLVDEAAARLAGLVGGTDAGADAALVVLVGAALGRAVGVRDTPAGDELRALAVADVLGTRGVGRRVDGEGNCIAHTHWSAKILWGAGGQSVTLAGRLILQARAVTKVMRTILAVGFFLGGEKEGFLFDTGSGIIRWY